MMDLLNNMMGGGQNRQEYEDYVQRYDQGSPFEGYSDQEAYDRYQRVAPHLPPDLYQQSAEDAFSRMSPQERMQFGQLLQQRSRQQGMNFPDLNHDGVDDRMQDPRYLAQITGRMQQQQPGMLEQLLGGGQQRSMGGGAGNLLSNPLAKAALGGIAAMALKRMMSGGAGGQMGGLGGLGGLGGGQRRGGGGFGGVDM